MFLSSSSSSSFNIYSFIQSCPFFCFNFIFLTHLVYCFIISVNIIFIHLFFCLLLISYIMWWYLYFLSEKKIMEKTKQNEFHCIPIVLLNTHTMCFFIFCCDYDLMCDVMWLKMFKILSLSLFILLNECQFCFVAKKKRKIKWMNLIVMKNDNEIQLFLAWSMVKTKQNQMIQFAVNFHHNNLPKWVRYKWKHSFGYDIFFKILLFEKKSWFNLIL